MAETEYLVRFSLRVKADNPGDAVDGVVDLFVEKGLRDWVYRVDDPAATGADSLIGFYDGYGDPVDVDQLLADIEEEPVAIPVSSVEPVPAESDDELLAEAQALLNATE